MKHGNFGQSSSQRWATLEHSNTKTGKYVGTKQKSGDSTAATETKIEQNEEFNRYKIFEEFESHLYSSRAPLDKAYGAKFENGGGTGREQHTRSTALLNVPSNVAQNCSTRATSCS